MKSKFRKIFWIRIVSGVLIFVLFSIFLVNALMNFETKNLFPIVIAAVTLLFLSYMSTGLFKIFKIRISNEEIVTTNFITKFEKSIPLSSITKIEKEKVRFRNSRGNISDGHCISIIKFSNNKLVISPDSFENYEELINYIKHKLQNRNVA